MTKGFQYIEDGTGYGVQYAVAQKNWTEVRNVTVHHALQARDCLYDIIKYIKMHAEKKKAAINASTAKQAAGTSGPDL